MIQHQVVHSTSGCIHLDAECQSYLWILDQERHQVSVDTDLQVKPR